MKKILAMFLVLMMSFSLVACGGKDSNSESSSQEETTLTKEDLLSQAENVGFGTLYSSALSNKAKAQSLYCDKIIKTSGRIIKVQSDHVVIANGDSVEVLVDVYLGTEDLLSVKDTQQITVVGYMSGLEEREELWGTMPFLFQHYIMEDAFLVD